MEHLIKKGRDEIVNLCNKRLDKLEFILESAPLSHFGHNIFKQYKSEFQEYKSITGIKVRGRIEFYNKQFILYNNYGKVE